MRVQKVMRAASNAGHRYITKALQTQKFEFDDQKFRPSELIEKVKNGCPKRLDPNRIVKRLCVYHQGSGDVVLINRCENSEKWQNNL